MTIARALQDESDTPVPLARSEEQQPWRNPRLAGRIQELDGVRGLAILLVLLQHYVVDSAHGQTIGWKAHAVAALRLSWSGVDLFFVLSGFLIGGILIEAKTAHNYYRTFYMRRLHRIVPLYYVLLVLFAVGVYLSRNTNSQFLVLLFKRPFPYWTYPVFVQNVPMSLQNGVGPLWLGITWSLAVEEQFYLLLPMVIRCLSIRGILRTVCSAILLAPLLRFVLLRYGCGPLASYALLPCRADALGFGVLIAIALRAKMVWVWLDAHRKHIWLFFLLLGLGVCGLVFVRQPFANPLFVSLGFSLLGAFYASLVLLAVVNPGRIGRLILGWRPLVSLGVVAYSVYLFHEGVNFLIHGKVLGSIPSFDDWRSIFLTLVSLVTVLFLAAVTWRAMERPLIERARAKYRYSKVGAGSRA